MVLEEIQPAHGFLTKAESIVQPEGGKIVAPSVFGVSG
jgi:hypothetical protein